MTDPSHSPTLSDNDAQPDSAQRHPVESLASDVVDSLRRGKDTSAIHAGATRPNTRALAAERGSAELDQRLTPTSDGEMSDDEQAAEELRDLLPLIETLENARRKQVDSVSKLATLGPARPDRLGDFLLKEIIGRGGMGVVFEALQESLGRIVAVKVLPATMLSDSEQTERFDREARMAARLHHTNIVPVFGVGSQDGFHYFVMQRIDGRGLDQWISDSKEPLTPRQVAHLGKQAADALAYAHTQGVLHRDVKPSNLIVSDEHRLWVTDFGVAKAMEAEVMTRTGDVVGTLRYMAPEQLLGESDTRSDVYGLGVTLYEALAGRPAIDDATLRDLLMHRRSAAAPPSLRSLNSSVPEDLQRIISTAMSREPADRYASADRMAADLQRFLDGKPISVRPLSRQQTFIRWCKRNPAIASLSAASLSFLLLATVASSVGFFTAREALVREQTSREEAEQSSRLATEALQTIFDRFAPLGAGILGDLGDLETPERLASAPAALSPEAADLLEGLLGYYDRLAQQKGAQQAGAQTTYDDSVAVAALNAYAAMGSIHFQLGAYSKSIEAFSRAVKQMDSVEFPASERERRLASLENQIGLAHRYRGDHDGAKRHHHQAYSLLSDLEPTTQVQLRIAHTHYLLGLVVLPEMTTSLYPPPDAFSIWDKPPAPGERRPIPERKHVSAESTADLAEAANQARSILDQLSHRSDSDPTGNSSATTDSKQLSLAAQLLLASSLRELTHGHLTESRSTYDQHTSEAIAILQKAFESYPHSDRIRVQLAESLADINVMDPKVMRGELDTYIDRLREATGHFQSLTNAHPSVPRITSGLVHATFKLGRLLELEADSERAGRRNELQNEAVDQYRHAAMSQAALVRLQPNTPALRGWQAAFLLHQGRLQLRASMLDQATRSLSRSSRLLQRVLPTFPDQSVCLNAIDEASNLAADAYYRMGEDGKAEEILLEADLIRMLPSSPQ